MDSATSSLLKLDNHHEYDSLYFAVQPPPLGAWDQHLVFPDHCFDQCVFWDQYQYQYTFPQKSSEISYLGFKDFEDICGELGWWDVNNEPFEENMVVDAKPLNSVGQFDQYENVTRLLGSHAVSWVESSSSSSSVSEDRQVKLQSGRYKSAALKLDEIQKYFDVPLTKAAKELKVGLTVLKKRCRELNIMRWPHRKIKSLKSLIDSVKELGLTNEIEMLEEHKRMLQELPEMELTERTKKLRQACFKANYKKRRALAATLI